MLSTRARYKFLVPGLIVLSLLFLSGVLGLILTNQQRRDFEEASTKAVQVSRLTEQIQYWNGNLLHQLFLYSTDRNPEHLQIISDTYLKVFPYLEELKKIVSEDRTLEIIHEFEKSYQSISVIISNIVEATKENDQEEVQGFFSEFLSVHNINRSKITDIKSLSMTYVQDGLETFKSTYNWMWGGLLVTLVICLMALIGLITYYELAFILPLKDLSTAIKKMERSDFSLEIPPIYHDELGELNSALTSATREIRTRIESERLLNRKLMAANDELRHFSYITSHDLKEPLRQVRMYVELIQYESADQLTKEAQEHLRTVIKGCDRMTAMIQGLEALFKIDHKQSEFKEVNLNQVASDVIDNLKGFIDESGAKIELTTLPSVRGDYSQIVELVQNLVQNAIKYNKSETPKVKIYSLSNPQEPNTCVIAIQDNGLGISEKYIERIFRLFSRLHSRDEYPGSGIGLAICRKIVQNHGGKIWVKSEEGKGSTFYVSLPIVLKK